MLSKETLLLIERGLERGLIDRLIAKPLKLATRQVAWHRKKLNLANEVLLERRYDTWASLLSTGYGVDAVAEMYDVKPETITLTLSRRGVVVRDLLALAQKKRDKELLAAIQKAHPFSW